MCTDLVELLESATTQMRRAREALERVTELHRPITYEGRLGNDYHLCYGCMASTDDTESIDWPCLTIKAITNE